MKLHAFVPLISHPEPNAGAAAAQAPAFAAAVGAALHAVAIDPDIPDVSNALSRLLLDTPDMIRRAEAESRRQSQRLLSLVREKAEAAGLDITTATVSAPLPALGDTAALHARYFDFGIVGWEAGNATTRMTAEAMIFGSGRPAVLLPAELRQGAPGEHLAVAWDGSRVAARAVADARLLIERARRVSVITVPDDKPLGQKDPGGRLAEALRGRGMDAHAITVGAEDAPISETLQQAAIEAGASLLVMGGYGHSRLRDFVLGGATEGVLTDLRMPVLLSH